MGVYSIMHLSSKIVAEDSSELRKELQCYFDHPFELVHAANSPSDPHLSLIRHSILPYLFALHNQSEQNQCLVVYKYELDAEELLRMAGEEEGLEVEVLEYDHKSKVMHSRLKSQQEIGERVRFGDESTIIIELRTNSKTTKAYLLPFSRGEEETLVSRAIHENFKLLKVLKQFVMLESSWKGSLQFQQPIFRHLSSFLYGERVRMVRMVLWIERGSFDKKLLQQVGELKLPQVWLEKQEYRLKKEEMFITKSEQHQLLANFRSQKEEFSKTINTLQKLAGIPQQSYEEINIDTLKQLKQEGFVQKTAEIKELQNTLAKLSLRETNLRERMAECRGQMLQVQKKHVSEILALKKEVGALQQPKEGQLGQSSKMLFSRSRKSTDHKVIKTIFSHVDKKAQRINETDNQFNRISDNSEGRSRRDPRQTQLKKQEFKNNEKKVASVVKDGTLQVDRKQLREDYEDQISKIDFQMEKRYNQMLSRYEQAAKAIRHAMEDTEDMTI